jgi:hypothetical protein
MKRVFRTDENCVKAYVPRADGREPKTWTGASDARGTMIVRHFNTDSKNNYPSAKAAREAMINKMTREDSTEEDIQRELAGLMAPAFGDPFCRNPETGEDMESGVARVYGSAGMNKPACNPRSADEARQQMIDRMTGACPDRLPQDKR